MASRAVINFCFPICDSCPFGVAVTRSILVKHNIILMFLFPLMRHAAGPTACMLISKKAKEETDDARHNSVAMDSLLTCLDEQA
jgi:hypothetical protein